MYLQDDLDVSGSFSGSLIVLTFENSTEWVEKEDTQGGSFYIETKDFDFENPSSLKNINYVDISMKCKDAFDINGNPVQNIPRVEFCVNNKNFFIPFSSSGQALSSEFKTYRYKMDTGSIGNINSIRLRILPSGTTAADKFISFELNDITIVYREKQL